MKLVSMEEPELEPVLMGPTVTDEAEEEPVPVRLDEEDEPLELLVGYGADEALDEPLTEPDG